MDQHYCVHDQQLPKAMQMARKLLEVTHMKGSRITATICTVLAGLSFIGVLTGATHQLAIALPLTILAIVLFNKKTFNA